MFSATSVTSDGGPSPTTNTYEELFSAIKSSMLYHYGVRMVYMTGTLPVLPIEFFGSWNVVPSKTFSPEFGDLFSPTSSDVSEAVDSLFAEDVMKSVGLKELTYYMKGYPSQQNRWRPSNLSSTPRQSFSTWTYVMHHVGKVGRLTVLLPPERSGFMQFRHFQLSNFGAQRSRPVPGRGEHR